MKSRHGGKREGVELSPAPEGDFAVTIRAYVPKEDLIKGEWAPPAVLRSAK